MKICIGGELEGQDIEKEGFSFKVDPSDQKSSGYYRQSVIIGDQIFCFWFSDVLTFSECMKTAERLSRQQYKN